MQEIDTQKLTGQEAQLVKGIPGRVIDAVKNTGTKNPEQEAARQWENFNDVLQQGGICAITGLLVQAGLRAGFLGGATALTGESTAAAGANNDDLAVVHFQVLDAMCDAYRVYRRPISFRELEDLAEGI